MQLAMKKIAVKNAEKKIVNNVYEINYLDPYIDNTVNPPAIGRLNNWLDENVVVFGTENKLIINILEASLTKIERSSKLNILYMMIMTLF